MIRTLFYNLWLCSFAVLATLAAIVYVLWLIVVVNSWEWLVFRFNYGWKAKITPRRWL